jgi:hypothetical protein
MPANMTSVRLTILQAIESYFAAMQADQPADDPMGITWSTVAMGPLIKDDHRRRYSLGLVPGPEKESFEFPYVMCFLTLNVEFRITHNQGDAEPGVLAEQALTVIKRGLTVDRTWGGIAIDTKITNSEVDLITYADRAVVGVVVASIQYRYGYDDPRNPYPT